MPGLPEPIRRLLERPAVAHLLRTNERFTGRLGTQGSAAAAYFSVLALVPLLSLAFSLVGFLLTVVRPDLRDDVAAAVTDRIGTGATAQQILSLINDALANYAGVASIGAITGAYAGANWMGNLKNAVQAQMRADFDAEIPKRNIVVATLVNLVTLLGLIIAIAITFGLATLSTTVTGDLLGFFGLQDVGWLVLVLRIAPIVVSLGAGWLFFMYLFTVLPERPSEPGTRRRGAMIGSVGLLVLQYATGLLFNAFSGNAAVSVFGPVITLLLFFNLFARLILFVAAWIATAGEPAFVPVGPPVQAAALSGPVLAQLADAIRSDPSPVETPAPVPQAVAARSVQVGLSAGYLTGAATGVGLGALAAWAAQGWRRWRDDRHR
ncbi:MAG: YhjD/YihY/BrkB family envelope integrity protein [Propionibacteriaceae bacterium]